MTKISFTVQGSGFPVILLHGFPFHKHIWADFSTALSANAKVYTPDLPGLGEGEPLKENFSIGDVAQAIIRWTEQEKIERCCIVGHSLGGYITLEIANQKPALCASIGLFHSTALADTHEKKESRTKVMEFVRKNDVEAFTSNFIEPLFADHNNPAIPVVRKIAMQASAQAVIAYTLAMRDRKNHEDLLKTFPQSILFLAGEKDQGIPVKSIYSQAQLCQKAEVHILNTTAHMGMFEQRKESLEIIGDFIARTSGPD
jgi:pimeloyl-ACP methyl ester carboxylesterase